MGEQFSAAFERKELGGELSEKNLTLPATKNNGRTDIVYLARPRPIVSTPLTAPAFTLINSGGRHFRQGGPTGFTLEIVFV